MSDLALLVLAVLELLGLVGLLLYARARASVKDVQTYRVGTRVHVRIDPTDRERAAVVGVAGS